MQLISAKLNLTGSSVNPLTPFPVVRTTIVALPNRAYPAATKLLPDWRASSNVAGPSCVYNTMQCKNAKSSNSKWVEWHSYIGHPLFQSSLFSIIWSETLRFLLFYMNCIVKQFHLYSKKWHFLQKQQKYIQKNRTVFSFLLSV